MVEHVRSRRYALLFREARVLGFHLIKELYKENDDFIEMIQGPPTHGPFQLQDGFLFKHNKLCISKYPLSDLIIKEAHGGALACDFGINKILDILKEKLY